MGIILLLAADQCVMMSVVTKRRLRAGNLALLHLAYLGGWQYIGCVSLSVFFPVVFATLFRM